MTYITYIRLFLNSYFEYPCFNTGHVQLYNVFTWDEIIVETTKTNMHENVLQAKQI